jgi:hypothetical protein
MDDSLLYGLATIGAGLVALIVRYAFKSKCTEITLCCGGVHIVRDTQLEMEEGKMDGQFKRQDTTDVSRV